MLLQAARERAAWYIGKKSPAAAAPIAESRLRRFRPGEPKARLRLASSDIGAFPAAKSVVFAAFRVA
jgi:hypothetical protein